MILDEQIWLEVYHIQFNLNPNLINSFTVFPYSTTGLIAQEASTRLIKPVKIMEIINEFIEQR